MVGYASLWQSMATIDPHIQVVQEFAVLVFQNLATYRRSKRKRRLEADGEDDASSHSKSKRAKLEEQSPRTTATYSTLTRSVRGLLDDRGSSSPAPEVRIHVEMILHTKKRSKPTPTTKSNGCEKIQAISNKIPLAVTISASATRLPLSHKTFPTPHKKVEVLDGIAADNTMDSDATEEMSALSSSMASDNDEAEDDDVVSMKSAKGHVCQYNLYGEGHKNAPASCQNCVAPVRSGFDGLELKRAAETAL